MKTSTLDSFIALSEELGAALANAVRYGLRAISTMSVPMLVMTCILLAMFISIAPLALFLFIVFMALKLIAGKKEEPVCEALPTATDAKGE
jgi:hypothetical protein